MKRESGPAHEMGGATEFDAENPATEEMILEEELYAEEGIDGALGAG